MIFITLIILKQALISECNQASRSIDNFRQKTISKILLEKNRLLSTPLHFWISSEQ